jgi:hypothetical protein
VNCIAMLPPTQDAHDTSYGSHVCWGYDPLSLFAAHAGYGPPDSLKFFIGMAHELGISVILDWVPNHLSSLATVVNFDGSAPSPGVTVAPGDTPRGCYLYVRCTVCMVCCDCASLAACLLP